jgi:hypothetical protein
MKRRFYKMAKSLVCNEQCFDSASCKFYEKNKIYKFEDSDIDGLCKSKLLAHFEGGPALIKAYESKQKTASSDAKASK